MNHFCSEVPPPKASRTFPNSATCWESSVPTVWTRSGVLWFKSDVFGFQTDTERVAMVSVNCQPERITVENGLLACLQGLPKLCWLSWESHLQCLSRHGKTCLLWVVWHHFLVEILDHTNGDKEAAAHISFLNASWPDVPWTATSSSLHRYCSSIVDHTLYLRARIKPFSLIWFCHAILS